MKANIKTTGFKIDEPLRVYIDQKIVKTVEKFLKRTNISDSAMLDIEIEKETRHHKKGMIWRAEANLSFPKSFLRAEAEAEDIRSSIDMVEAELFAELRKHKEKQLEKGKRKGRLFRNEMKVDPSARRRSKPRFQQDVRKTK